MNSLPCAIMMNNYQQFDDKQFKIPPTSSSLVSSSSPPVSVSQSSAATMVIMRPPPPPPLKITTKINPDLIKKEEPTSSIPDLGKSIYLFSLFFSLETPLLVHL